MTTVNQIKANRTNASKSTGAKTAQGKAALSNNALKHGLFAKHLILEGESQEEYHQLLNGLISSLNPVGVLEILLVEKIAIATWKQIRLTRAESASIELGRRMEIKENRDTIGKALSRSWLVDGVTLDEVQPETAHDREHFIGCEVLIREYYAVDDDDYDDEGEIVHEANLIKNDVIKIKNNAPTIYGHLIDHAYDKAIDLDSHLHDKDDTSLNEWARNIAKNLFNYSQEELKRLERKKQVLSVAKQLNNKLTAPINNELVSRYQASIDNELYKAIEALRKQQEWRSKSMAVLENEL